jgi:anti-sigma factor RsiW
VTGRDRATVAEHVLTCPSCRSTMTSGRQVRQLLRERTTDLRSTAPADLRRRIEVQVGRLAPMAVPGHRPRVGWAPRSAAAALLLGLLGMIAAGTLAPRGTLLAAQLGFDHLKCLWLADRHHGADAVQLARGWQLERGWTIEVPPSSAADRLELVALRRCLYGDGEMAHLVYERDGRSVSLFILPRPRETAPEVEIMGLGAVAWSRDGRTYAVVGDVPLDELTQLAAYLRPLAR